MPIYSRWDLAHSNEFGGGGLIPHSQMNVMSLTYRKAVRGLIREERMGIGKQCSKWVLQTYQFLKRPLITYQTTDRMQLMVAAVAEGGASKHPHSSTSLDVVTKTFQESAAWTNPDYSCNGNGDCLWCKTHDPPRCIILQGWDLSLSQPSMLGCCQTTWCQQRHACTDFSAYICVLKRFNNGTKMLSFFLFLLTFNTMIKFW